MKRYKVLVNGNEYEVQVEEMDATASAAAPPSVKKEAPEAESLVPQPKVSVQQPTSGVTRVSSPLPGKVVEIEVSPGEEVSNGQTLLILEAMKMENEIVAPRSGIVDVMGVDVGMIVEAGDFLVSLK